MYKASVSKKSFEIVNHNHQLFIDGAPLEWDMVQVSKGYFHILINHKSFRAEVVKADPSTKSFALKINGKIYTVELKDKFDLLLEKMGMNNGSSGKANHIKAPMPGLIIDLRVKEGDTGNARGRAADFGSNENGKYDQGFCQSVVKSVKVKKGDSVEKNQVLIEF